MKLPLFSREKILADKKSLYQRLLITEEGGVRYLRFGNRIVQGAVFLDNPVLPRIEYIKYLPLGLLFPDNPTDILNIGLGAGALQRRLAQHCPNIRMDTVEIDPLLLELAEQYLLFSHPPGFEIHILDARAFLRRCNKEYDVIIHDAFSADAIPFHLTTVEFLREAQSRLKPGGVITANLWSSQKERFLASLRTYEQVFPFIYRFPAYVGKNVIIVASRREFSPDAILNRAQIMQTRSRFPFDFPRCASRLETGMPETTSERIFRDEDAAEVWLGKTPARN